MSYSRHGWVPGLHEYLLHQFRHGNVTIERIFSSGEVPNSCSLDAVALVTYQMYRSGTIVPDNGQDTIEEKLKTEDFEKIVWRLLEEEMEE